MASENETVAEIVKELRDEPFAENGAKPWLHYLADRIEAAHKRELNQLPCNARDAEGSSLRIGWEGENEYCVVAKYTEDKQNELGDYDYHRVTGALNFDSAKHWLDFNQRNRTREEDPKMLVRQVSRWRLFDPVKEGNVK